MSELSFYGVLGVSPTATPEEIKTAYKKLSMIHHPDRKGGDADLFMKIKEAYEVLSDPIRRAQYDADIEKGPSSLAAVYTRVVKVFETAINNCGPGEDMIDASRDVVRKLLHDNETRLAKAKLHTSKAKEAAHLVKVDGIEDRDNLWLQAVGNHVSGSIANEAKLRDEVAVLKKMLTIIDNYTWVFPSSLSFDEQLRLAVKATGGL